MEMGDDECTGIGIGNIGRLVRIEPNLALTNLQNTSGKTFLESGVRPKKQSFRIQFIILTIWRWMLNPLDLGGWRWRPYIRKFLNGQGLAPADLMDLTRDQHILGN